MVDTMQGNVNSSSDRTPNPNGINASMAGSEGEAAHQEKRKRASAKKYKAFDDAKKFAQGLSLKSRKEWREYVKGKRSEMTSKPDDIPAHPDGIYKTKGWQGWRHWLGTEKPGKDSLN